MPSDSTLTVGSRWLSRHGRHTGQQVTVVKAGTASVQIRVIPNTGDSSHAVAKPYAVSRETFLARFVPYSAAVIDPAYVGGGGWKKNGVQAPSAPEYHGPQAIEPAVGVISPGASSLNIEVLLITPSLAQAWLDRSTKKNRHLREGLVRQYAAAMGRGEWRLTGESIKIDADGNIRDGQHRLYAIVQSQTPITSLVVRGVDETAFDVMDSGARRTQGDIVGLHAYPDANVLAGAARLLLLLERFGDPIENAQERRAYVSTAMVLAYVDSHPDIIEGGRMAGSIRNAIHPPGGASAWAATCTLLHRRDPEAAVTFIELIKTGAGLEVGHPVLLLRRRLFGARVEEARFSKSREARAELMAIIIKTWNAWRRGESPGTLRWPGKGPKGGVEAFPIPE